MNIKKINNAEFCKRLVRLRTLKDLSVDDMCHLLEVPRRTYQRWESERDHRLPSDPNVIVAMAEVLDTTTDYLLTGRFGERLGVVSTKDYLDIYERYKLDADFHIVLSVLLKADTQVVATIAELMERIDDQYRGIRIND